MQLPQKGWVTEAMRPISPQQEVRVWGSRAHYPRSEGVIDEVETASWRLFAA